MKKPKYDNLIRHEIKHQGVMTGLLEEKMDTLNLTESKRSPINFGWMILSCIPFMNWSGFLLLGSRANQKKWTILGYVHFVLSLASARLFASWLVSHDYLANTFNDFGNLFPYLMFVSWLIGVVQTWWISGEAKKRLERQIGNRETAHSNKLTPTTRMERIQSNLVYILFLFVPLSGLSLVHIGKTIRRKKLQIFGWVSFALCILLSIAFVILFNAYDRIYHYNYALDTSFYSMHPLRPFFTILTLMPILFFWVVALLLCIRTKSEYASATVGIRTSYSESLEQRNQEYEQLKLRYPCLQSRAWKIKKSIYLLWCLPIITSPIALIHTGISDHKGQRLACGIGILLYYALCITYMVQTEYWNYIEWLSFALLFLLFVIWIAIIWFSIASLRSHLIYTAEKCGGYCDSFDAEESRLRQASHNQNEAFYGDEH